MSSREASLSIVLSDRGMRSQAVLARVRGKHAAVAFAEQVVRLSKSEQGACPHVLTESPLCLRGCALQGGEPVT